MILAIDTATQYAGLALYSSDGLFAEETWFAGRNHTVQLMPRIQRMLQNGQIPVENLSAIAVALGPGSFTGLRIGIATAKGLALPHKLSVIGIPTLEAAAYPFRAYGVPVWAIAEAGRGRIVTACFEHVDDAWQVTAESFVTNFTDLAPQITRPSLCVGEIDQESAKLLEQGSRQKAKVVSTAARLRRAGYLAEIAAQRLAAGAPDDPETLVPIYTSNPA